MLNKKITEKTPMVEILERIHPAIIPETENQVDSFKIAQGLIQELFEMQNCYRAAIKEISTKLEILSDEFQHAHERNPIHTMKSRIKSPKSVVEKLARKGFELTCESARENLDDIAGVRIVCPYIEDIYTVKQLLKAQDDIELVRVTDYIKEPKPNGYRSLHLIVRVPVFFSDHKEQVKVEVQVRTIAMDFWASLEHQLRYKAVDPENIPESVSRELKECADTIAETDLRMQDIHNQVIR
ncbi:MULTISPECIES: GTP pyrophosphokinase [Eubacterium]|uniref:Putative GTP pyrophosphokinase n=1 Tax=Eubacterium barkeri TaxID=1528 RepID=A0A1H3K6B5_EUBBA|nr:GTP pyrophosphokinase family protein [Eubacterium barkeri]SDY47747.1 putative GTP pyrophosphokinase [Eubacterium barkeri]